MKYAALLFSIFIIAIVVLADRGQLGPIGHIYDFPYGDKLGHFVLFGLLNFFLTVTFIRVLTNRDRKWIALTTGMILAVIIGCEEYSQKFFAHRTFDLVDLSASYLGLIVGSWAALKYERKSHR